MGDSYRRFLLVSLPYLSLPALLAMLILPGTWSQRSTAVGPFEILCIAPSLAGVFWAPKLFTLASTSQDNAQMQTKLQIAALCMYALAELGLLWGVFVSKSQYGVYFGYGAFPISFLIGFVGASRLWPR